MRKIRILALLIATVLVSCKNTKDMNEEKNDDFKFLLEQFADAKIMRYQIPGFDELSLKQKELLYYLSEAANCGHDIIFDQFYKHNLIIKRTNEAIIEGYQGDKSNDDFAKFLVYAKRVWFSNGIHHHYSTDKFYPEISEEYFASLINNTDKSLLPLAEGESTQDFIARITPIIFNEDIDNKRIVLDSSKDIVAESASNFYEGVTLAEVEALNNSFVHPNADKPLSVALNSKILKENGKVVEKVYSAEGMYAEAINKIVYWLEKAVTVAENEQQKQGLQLLIDYYNSGSLQIWDDYNVAWVSDLESRIDYVNGFIESYGDPLGMKATWESVVNFKNLEATKRTEIISDNAQWFEDNAPTDPRFKKAEVKGVTAKVITAVQLGGDCYPTTPIGINLPNADWIRKDHGSKSVTIDNITYAYDKASQGNGFMEEFYASEEEIALAKKHGSLAGNLHTDLHECLGHGSGQLLPGTKSDALKNYSSALEETRADLFALYYIADEKLVELGLIESLDVAKAEYNSYLRNGYMTQLTRIKPGKDIEQAHMRNRQLIAKWSYDLGKDENVIEVFKRDDKTFIKINDYDKLRALFGKMLAEIQRIKSEGDFEAGKALVEKYAVKVDQELHAEILERYAKLNIAPYGGFVNPVLKPVMENDKIVDVTVEYTEDYTQQMMRLAKEYSFLPNYN